MPKVTTKLLKNLPKEDYMKCLNLNFRGEGYMMGNLHYARKYPNLEKCRVYMVKDESNKLLSWALVNETRSEIHFYTRKSERRKGYGSQISRKICKDYKPEEFRVEPHDDISEAFYKDTPYELDRYG